MANLKICLVIPEYDETTPTHFKYWQDFLRILSPKSDIFLIAEKGKGIPDFLNRENFYCQKFKFFPLRIMENLLIIFFVRCRGYKDFYIHYSFLSAFNASLAVKILSGRTFYWNCGLPWLYKKSFLREKFEGLIYRTVNFLVTGTEGLKEEYSRHYRIRLERIRVFPNWIDLSQAIFNSSHPEAIRSALNISDQAKVILFVHRLSNRKGAYYLPAIAEALKGQNVVLVIIGDGPEKKNLELKIKELGLGGAVRMLGWVPNQKLMPYLAMADLFIMPSEEEGFPHVLLEAMAIGIPFIAFDAGGVKEICPPEMSDYVIPAGEINNFIKKIQAALAENQEKLKLLRSIEQNWVKKFDIKLAAEKFKNLVV